MYGYIATHNKGTTLVLSDGRVFEKGYGRPDWYLSEEGVDFDAWTEKATQEWGADWSELSEDEIAEKIDLSNFIGQSLYTEQSKTEFNVGDKVRLNPDYSLEEIEKILNIPIDFLRDIRQDNLVGQVTAIVAGDYAVKFSGAAGDYLFTVDFLVPAGLLVDEYFDEANDESAANLSRETLAANFLSETSDAELKALHDNYGTLRELLREYVQAYQDDLSHDVFARDFFGESIIKASGLEDTLPYPDEWDDDDDDE